MNKVRKFIKTSAIYLIGTVFSKALMFILLPIYTKYLSPEAYGLYDLSITYNTLVYSVLYLDIFGVIMRFMYDYKEGEKQKPIFNGGLIFCLSTILYSALIAGLAYFDIQGFEHPKLLLLVGISTILQQTVGFIARAFQQDKVFVVGGMIGTVLTFILTYVFLVLMKDSYESIYLATTVGMFVSSLYISHAIHLFRQIKITNFDLSLLKDMGIYALPLSVNSAAFWFLTGFNRYVIATNLSLADNGFFAVAAKFSGLVNLVTNAFQMAFQEIAFENAHQSDADKSAFFTKALNSYVRFLFAGVTLILPILNLVFPFFVSSDFSAAQRLVPLALLSAIFSSIAAFLASMLSSIKKTNYIFSTTVQAALVNVVVILSLVHFVGVQAANISLLLGFMVMVFTRMRLLNKYVTISFDFKKTIVDLAVFFFIAYFFVHFRSILNVVVFVGIVGYEMIANRDLLVPVRKRLKK